MSDHTAGGHPAVLRSDHASRRHDAGRLYVNAQDSFSCAGNRGGMKPYASGFHRHHITRPSKSFSRFENFGKRCGVRLCWHFLRTVCFSEMTVLLGFQNQKFSRNEISFFQGHDSIVSRNQPRSIVASRAKVAPFALCLLDGMRPQTPFTSANAVVALRISGIRHRDGTACSSKW